MTIAAPPLTRLSNFMNGRWVESTASEWIDVTNPATGETIAKVPLSSAAEVAAVVESAAAAYPEWRRTPPEDRIQP
ncbi:MAG: aldehyde dehydrogenase family protein, partial [Candidatus Sulfotelmatobacter sp.]